MWRKENGLRQILSGRSLTALKGKGRQALDTTDIWQEVLLEVESKWEGMKWKIEHKYKGMYDQIFIFGEALKIA